MGEFFGSMYCWFEDLFGLELANYLWGEATEKQDSNMFIGIGLSMIGITFLMTLLFYYAVNRPKFNNWWSWFIALCINAAINFIVGWQWVLRHYYDGSMKTLNPVTNQEVDLNIDESDCLCFGVSNMILSIIAFILISYMIKWWSTNCSKAPF